jgi:hypothetical protein
MIVQESERTEQSDGMPIRDNRTTEQIPGCDEHGLPR